MKVIGGQAKGRLLKASRGGDTRPTSDKVKEALFDILSSYVEGSFFVDLYAGFGGVGIEALSRGAREAVFVEKDPRNCAVIRLNLRNTGLEGRGKVYQGEAISWVGAWKPWERGPFLVFLDPPYEKDLVNSTLKKIGEKAPFFDLTIVAAEHSRRESVPGEVNWLRLVRQYRYGDTVISLYTSGKGDTPQ